MANVAEYVRIILASEFKAKAFKEADKSINKLEKGVKKLGKSFGLALGSAAIISGSKALVKAFAEDEAAVRNLSNTVKNLGLAFADADIQSFIDQLTLASSVADSKLRPAFSRLLTTTGSVTKSQELLKKAIDISRGSGIDIEKVVMDLSNAYVGNTKGLKAYGLGLTAAELKTASFSDVMDAFMQKFSGANQAYLTTTAGKMDLIKNSAAEAAETIGKGIVDAFNILAGDKEGLGKISDLIQKIGTNTADFIRGLAQGFKDLANMPVIKQLMQLAALMLKIAYKTAGLVIDPFVKEGARGRASALAPSSANPHLAGLQADLNAKKAAKAEKDAAKRAKSIADQLKAQSKAQSDALKQKKLAGIFDMEQAQIMAALQGKISDEERKRLELMLAMQQGNVNEAQKLANELAGIQGKTSMLATYLRTLPDAKNPFASWSDYLKAIEAQISRIANMPAAPVAVASMATNVDAGGFATNNPSFQFGAGTPWAQAAQNFTITVEGGDELTTLMRYKIIEASSSGSGVNWSQSVGAYDR